jgi:Domain of unknown function (DUF4878)
MKKTTSILCIAIILFCISCSRKKNDGNPKQVFTAFIKALKRNDFKEAESLATPASSSTFFVLNLGKDKLQKVLEKIDTTNLEVPDPIITGDTATITYTEKASNAKANFTLQKIDGEWLVAFDLDGILAMADGTNTSAGDTKINNTNNPILNLDSMEKDLKQQMKGLNMNVDSMEKEMKKLNPKDLERLIMENTK